MSNTPKKPTLLSLEGSDSQPLSIRAKALVFADPASQRLLDYIERLAPSEAPVLIIGETGTGKELVARHIHHLSGRSGPFLAVNCGAISEQLAESELFGHEAGSFTGAVGKREGWFEAANGGTLFLDEIGDLPLPMQVKLLRVLQEREVVRIGSRKSIAVDVRLVAATNVDLDHAVSAGHFRRDLLYRLNIAQARLPPLRERPGDVLPLVEHFLRSYSQRMGNRIPVLSSAAEEALLGYAWPGNIRELENVVHFALLIAPGDEIRPEHLKVTGGWGAAGLGSGNWNHPASSTAAREESRDDEEPLTIIARELRRLYAQAPEALFDELESLIVTEAFRHVRSNQVHAAALLGITRNVMRTLLKRHGLLADSGYARNSEVEWQEQRL
ncbi:MAG: sigma-54 dependent transcriptional regulator [Pedobacter sp.]|nr:sigma-54 dependent transcriptional regulator [Pedobacter sp.]